MLNRAQAFELEVKSLKSRMDGFARASDDATSATNGKGRGASTLELCIKLLKDELHSQKREKVTGCDMKIVGPMVAYVKDEMNN